MAFEGLSEKLQQTFKKLRGKGKLTEKDVKEGMREVKLALLEADVNFLVVKDFVNRVTERAIGSEVMESLTPGQQVVKIVNEQLTELMGGSPSRISFSSKGITKVMLVGLQGAGKTTAAAKLASYFKRHNNKSPLMIACDVYRPAAIKQLQIVGEKAGIPVFTMGDRIRPADIAKAGVSEAEKNGNNVVIIDTAGRLHVDEELMSELEEIKNSVHPDLTLLVVDAMTGQDAVNVADTFNKRVGIDGVVLTKLDGDTRGGAALSVKAVTGKPVMYAGIGEKIEDLEVFYPDRMASRILGMGDVITLIEKAQQSIDQKKALEMEKKLRSQQFTLEDFMEQLKQVKNMGPIDQLMGMIPGLNTAKMGALKVDEKELAHVEAIINSMTPEERRDPSIINGSRRRRIAAGSGTRIQDVNRLLKQFEQTRKLMKQFADMGKRPNKGKLGFPFMK
ncbi:MAG: Signal recognition particle protein Ffh [Firmicutes bacterium]|nr:Signal recognition particle protein Ffh [Bacillota bacterium]MDI6704643.1 signal recognition particle protein [Bacillota bacterium]